MNSFKKMLEEDEKKLPLSPADLESGLRGNINTIRHAGTMTDLYVGKVVGVLVSFAGGNPAPFSARYKNEKTTDGPAGPGGSY